jgi:hypothetical protein
MSSPLRRAEAGVAALLTLAAIWLHFVAVTSFGALWRDEANTVGLATLPTLRDVANNIQFDSFPILWLLLIREFSALVGVMNDPAFRALGFVVGVGVIGMLWLNARTFGHSFPFFSVVLLGLSPSVIVWGDSIRAYGMGIFLILLTAALLWRLLEQPSTGRFWAAALAAMASVQTLFYNSVLLLAFSVGALAVCAINRKWRTAGLVVLIGVLSAVSDIPYVFQIRAASSWNALVRMPDYTLVWFWGKLEEAIQPVGPWAMGLWFVLFVLALVAGLLALLQRGQRAVSRPPRGQRKLSRRQRQAAAVQQHGQPALSLRQRQVALFAVATLIVGVPGLILFLDRLSYYTQPWYYLSLLAMVAVCIDAIFGAVIHDRAARIARLVVVSVVAAASFLPALRTVRMRLTNIDLVAEQLQRSSDSSDVVLITPWYHGVAFSRYYRGHADWMTIPPLGFYRFHRYDLIKRAMMATDQTEPVREVIEKAGLALREGHRVFIVGWFEFPPPAQPTPPLPPAPLPDQGWPSDLYGIEWSRQVAYFLQRHAATVTGSPVEAPRRVNPFENVSLIVAKDWRP